MPVRTVAIMQPTYLPWVGYFDLIDRSDCFVFLDSVQFAKRSWQQRNRLKGQGQDPARWVTVPVLTKGRRDQTIAAVEIDPASDFPASHLKTIRHLYAKTLFFTEYFAELEGILHRHTRLADLNVDLIIWMCGRLGVATATLRSSTLDADGQKADLLTNICKQLGADRYLSAAGSREYIEESDAFASTGIDVVYHAYRPAEYRQAGEVFEPQLSTLDLLMNEGPASLDIIRRGRV